MVSLNHNSYIMVDPLLINPFKPEFTIVIFIQYKPRIAVAILDLYWMKMIWSGWIIKENYHVLETSFLEIFVLKPLGVDKLNLFQGCEMMLQCIVRT